MINTACIYLINWYTTFSFPRLQKKSGSQNWWCCYIPGGKCLLTTAYGGGSTLLTLCQLATSTTLHASAAVTSLFPHTGEDVHSAGLRSSTWRRTERHCQSDHISPGVKWERWTRTQRTDSAVDKSQGGYGPPVTAWWSSRPTEATGDLLALSRCTQRQKCLSGKRGKRKWQFPSHVHFVCLRLNWCWWSFILLEKVVLLWSNHTGFLAKGRKSSNDSSFRETWGAAAGDKTESQTIINLTPAKLPATSGLIRKESKTQWIPGFVVVLSNYPVQLPMKCKWYFNFSLTPILFFSLNKLSQDKNVNSWMIFPFIKSETHFWKPVIWWCHKGGRTNTPAKGFSNMLIQSSHYGLIPN